MILIFKTQMNIIYIHICQVIELNKKVCVWYIQITNQVVFVKLNYYVCSYGF